MRKSLWALLLTAIMFGAAAHADASMIVGENIQTLSQQADIVIRATCTDIERLKVGTRAAVRYTFDIGEAIVNKTGKNLGSDYELTQFAGFVTSSGKVVRPSVMPPRYVVGQEYVLFLPEKKASAPGPGKGSAAALQLQSPIGLNQGVFVVSGTATTGRTVSNPYMKVSMFRDLSVSVPGAAKALKAGGVTDVKTPPARLDAADFATIVRAFAGSN